MRANAMPGWRASPRTTLLRTFWTLRSAATWAARESKGSACKILTPLRSLYHTKSG